MGEGAIANLIGDSFKLVGALFESLSDPKEEISSCSFCIIARSEDCSRFLLFQSFELSAIEYKTLGTCSTRDFDTV